MLFNMTETTKSSVHVKFSRYITAALMIREINILFCYLHQWMQLRTRKLNLVRLFEKMQEYQFDQEQDPDKPMESHVRALTPDDIDRQEGYVVHCIVQQHMNLTVIIAKFMVLKVATRCSTTSNIT